jgi:hypothetical protein
MSNLKIWNRVPDGSVLEVWVESDEEAPLSAGARLLDDQGEELEWKDPDLRPGPATHVLEKPKSYVVRLRVFFAGEGEGVIRARIVKPDESIHGDPYSYLVTGNAGDVVRATIVVVTLKT